MLCCKTFEATRSTVSRGAGLAKSIVDAWKVGGRYGAASFTRLHVAWYLKGVVSVEPGAIRACVER